MADLAEKFYAMQYKIISNPAIKPSENKPV
jgi:hypothetical protein